MSKRFGRNDLVFLAGILLAAVILCGFFYLGNDRKGEQVTITVDGRVVGSYPLSEDAVIPIETEMGSNTLEIHDGKAKMTDADCPDKLCMHQKAIERNQETIVCLPHKLVISVESSTSGLDAVAN